MIIIISNNDKKKRSIDHTLSIYRLINNSCGMLGEEDKFVNHELRVTDAINDWFLTNQDARGTVEPVSSPQEITG